MSAIAGIFWFHGVQAEPGLVERLTAYMSRRGPDGKAHWIGGPVALGHCMLHSTPESLEENQLLTSADGNLIMVWDGRLDNRGELLHSLQAAGIVIRNYSDSEIALQSYIAWGEECPERLLGDFAFAVWDMANTRLFCARDHIGARPLFYAHTKDFFAFASEEEALLAIPGVAAGPNEDYVATIFEPAFNNYDHRQSCLENVWVLEPASRMTVSGEGGCSSEIYWRLVPGQEAHYATDQECVEAFLKVFGEAVRCRLRTEGDVALMMSGGMDSAAIAVMTRRIMSGVAGKNIHAYSTISDQPETCIESKCILSLAKSTGAVLHPVSVPSFGGMVDSDDLARIAWERAHPVDICVLLPAMMCFAAGKNGHKVMLHGACGDLTMYAPERYPSYLMQAGRWRSAWHECKAASKNHTFLKGTSPLSILAWNLGSAFLPRVIRPIARKLFAKRYLAFRGRAVNREFAHKVNLKGRMREQMSRQSKSMVKDLRQLHANMLVSMWSGLSAGLLAYDRVAGRYGLELRDPWADRRVVEFFVNLPLKYRVRDGWTKFLARTAFEAEMPPDVVWRKDKAHLGWAITKALMDDTEEYVAGVFKKELFKLAPYADLQLMKKLYLRSRSDKEPSVIEFIRDVAALVLWLQHISGPNPRA